MREIGVERFRLTFYKVIKGGFPVLVTNRKRPRYLLVKTDDKPTELLKCEMCKRERECILEGIDWKGTLEVKWMCQSCVARLISKGVTIV